VTCRFFVNGLASLVVVVLCGAVAAAVVGGVSWLLERAGPNIGVHARLVVGLVAPFGVVLFALLVEKIGRLTDHAGITAA
jgi:hypothetical protein